MDDFTKAVECFEEFCANNDVKPTNMKADYYIAGFLRGQKFEQEQVRPLAWQNARFNPPEVMNVKVRREFDSHLLAVTEEVLCRCNGKFYIDYRRLFSQYGDKENVWIWHILEGCEDKDVWWTPINFPYDIINQ